MILTKRVTMCGASLPHSITMMFVQADKASMAVGSWCGEHRHEPGGSLTPVMSAGECSSACCSL